MKTKIQKKMKFLILTMNKIILMQKKKIEIALMKIQLLKI